MRYCTELTKTKINRTSKSKFIKSVQAFVIEKKIHKTFIVQILRLKSFQNLDHLSSPIFKFLDRYYSGFIILLLSISFLDYKKHKKLNIAPLNQKIAQLKQILKEKTRKANIPLNLIISTLRRIFF